MDLVSEQCLHRSDRATYRYQLSVEAFALIKAFLEGHERRQELHIGRWIRAADRFGVDSRGAEQAKHCHRDGDPPHTWSLVAPFHRRASAFSSWINDRSKNLYGGIETKAGSS